MRVKMLLLILVGSYASRATTILTTFSRFGTGPQALQSIDFAGGT